MQDARWAMPGSGKEDRHPVESVRRLLAAAAVSGLLAACAWAAGPASPSGETVVCLYPTALVSTEQVTLADVAEISGEGAEPAFSLPIAPAPGPGQERVILLSHVRAALGEHGANLARWVFRGSTRCTVKRPTASPAGGDQPQHHQSSSTVGPRTDHLASISDVERDTSSGKSRPVSTAPAADPGQVDVSPDPVRIDPNTLAGAIHQHVRRRLANISGEPVLRFSPAVARMLNLSKPTYDFQITDQSERLLGTVPLQVAIFQPEQSKPQQVVPTLVEVSVRIPVVVASRPINRKQIIKATDLTVANRLIDRMDQIGLSDPAPLIGQRAKRLIDEGEKLTVGDIEPIPLVSRNDLVTAWVHRGNLKVKGTAKAMGTGGYGETIELKNEASRETFTAVVTGEKTVEIVGPNSGPVAVAALEASRNP